MAASRRVLISLSADFERQLHSLKAFAGDDKPFATFLVRLIELGRAQLDAQITAEELETMEAETEEP